MKKNIMIFSSSISIFIIFLISLIFYFRKILLINKKKFSGIISKIFAKLIYKKNKRLINEFLDLIIKIKKVKEIEIITESDNFFRHKNINKNNYIFFTEDIKYKNKVIGNLRITFIK